MGVLTLGKFITERKSAATPMHKTGAEFFPLGLNQRDFSVIFPSKKKKKEKKRERTEASS